MAYDEGRGRRVREAVARRKINKVHALAAELNVSVAAVSRWQNGGHLSLENACTLAQRLDISLDWLLLGRVTMDWHRDNAVSPGELHWIFCLRRNPVKIRNALTELVEVISPQEILHGR